MKKRYIFIEEFFFLFYTYKSRINIILIIDIIEINHITRLHSTGEQTI